MKRKLETVFVSVYSNGESDSLNGLGPRGVKMEAAFESEEYDQESIEFGKGNLDPIKLENLSDNDECVKPKFKCELCRSKFSHECELSDFYSIKKQSLKLHEQKVHGKCKEYMWLPDKLKGDLIWFGGIEWI